MSKIDDYATYEVVPEGYNLVEATPDKHAYYGIPPRPDATSQPQLFEFWKKLVSPPFTARLPVFQPKTISILSSAKREKRTQARLAPSGRGTVESFSNWSGGVISPPWPQRFVLAVGGWTVPTVTQPSLPALNTHSNESKTLIWVGIDGHNGTLPKASLPQIGTGHAPGQESFAWWYWWSHQRNDVVTKIDNFPIQPGDEILAGLAVLASEDVLYFIKNQSTGEFRSFIGRRQPLPDIEPLGSSAEWVVERPTDPGSQKPHPLADYGTVEFNYCMAMAADLSNAQGRVITLAQNGRMIKMREAFADPYRTVHVSRAKRRRDTDGSIGVTCTFQDPAWP